MLFRNIEEDKSSMDSNNDDLGDLKNDLKVDFLSNSCLKHSFLRFLTETYGTMDKKRLIFPLINILGIYF